jgi:hypothetical protein
MMQYDYLDELEDLIKTISKEMATISLDLPKCSKMTAAARRTRVASCNLSRDFKRFRKVSCLVGLK